MTKPPAVPKFIVKQLDKQIARAERAIKERQQQVEHLKTIRAGLIGMKPPAKEPE